MAEPSKGKYSALAGIRQPQAQSSVETADPRPAAIAADGAGRVGRPPGKRSDPSYQPTTVLLRKQTKKTASRCLEDDDSGQDLSELIEQLLTDWIQARS